MKLKQTSLAILSQVIAQLIATYFSQNFDNVMSEKWNILLQWLPTFALLLWAAYILINGYVTVNKAKQTLTNILLNYSKSDVELLYKEKHIKNQHFVSKFPYETLERFNNDVNSHIEMDLIFRLSKKYGKSLTYEKMSEIVKESLNEYYSNN
jgi:hypothetical protein